MHSQFRRKREDHTGFYNSPPEFTQRVHGLKNKGGRGWSPPAKKRTPRGGGKSRAVRGGEAGPWTSKGQKKEKKNGKVFRKGAEQNRTLDEANGHVEVAVWLSGEQGTLELRLTRNQHGKGELKYKPGGEIKKHYPGKKGPVDSDGKALTYSIRNRKSKKGTLVYFRKAGRKKKLTNFMLKGSGIGATCHDKNVARRFSAVKKKGGTVFWERGKRHL